jgi:hypothetical protein
MKSNNALMLGGAALLGYYLLKPKTGVAGINGYVENLHLISVKYIGPSNSRGTRLKIESKRFNQSITLAYDYRIGNIRDQAVQFLQSKGFSILGSGEFGNTDIIVSNTFNPLK